MSNLPEESKKALFTTMLGLSNTGSEERKKREEAERLIEDLKKSHENESVEHKKTFHTLISTSLKHQLPSSAIDDEYLNCGQQMIMKNDDSYYKHMNPKLIAASSLAAKAQHPQ